jgi:HSP20 family protein
MRMRYRYLTYRYIDGSPKQLEQHYRQLFDDAMRQSQHMLHRSSTWRPLADIREAAGYIMVTIELAGMKEEEIEVTLYEDALVISESDAMKAMIRKTCTIARRRSTMAHFG